MTTKPAPTEPYVHWFRHSAPYINAHRGKTFVLLFGGEAVNHANFHHTVHDIALLHALGIRLILVHGARPQIDNNIRRHGLTTRFHQGVRITPREALTCVMDAVGSVRLQIEALLSMGLANSPMYGARIDAVSGNFITARPYGIREGIDFALTGEVRSVDTQAILKQTENHHITILGPVGYSPSGEVFNLMAENVAVQVALAVNADKLICLSEYEGLEEGHHLLRELIPNEVDRYLRDRPLDNELLRYLDAARLACRGGVRRIHIVSYRRDGALLQELFTRDGSGTLITQDSYEEIREADIEDIGGLLELLRPMEEAGILVRRSREKLEHEINHFVVIERDGMIVGCAALYPLPQDNGNPCCAEIAGMAVHPDYQGAARGSELLQFLEKKATALGIKKLFVLTTRTAHWFIEHGFSPASVDDLPSSRAALYNLQRNSQVFSREI